RSCISVSTILWTMRRWHPAPRRRWIGLTSWPGSCGTRRPPFPKPPSSWARWCSTQRRGPCLTATRRPGNAIFYSPPDNDIYIAAKTQSGKFRFRIENTGVHIPNEDLSKIFEPFYRVDHSRSRQTGGSGLGLYIVQKILKQHGSECNVSNTERGVCFSFFL